MKSIQPRKKQIKADDLEKSFNQALSTAPLPVVQPKIEEEKPPPAVKAKKAPKNKPKVTKKPTTKRTGKVRVTIDLPEQLYKAMEQNKEETGQSYTFFIARLLKNHFGKLK